MGVTKYTVSEVWAESKIGQVVRFKNEYPEYGIKTERNYIILAKKMWKAGNDGIEGRQYTFLELDDTYRIVNQKNKIRVYIDDLLKGVLPEDLVMEDVRFRIQISLERWHDFTASEK